MAETASFGAGAGAGRSDAAVLRAFLRRGDLWPMVAAWTSFSGGLAALGFAAWAGWAWALGGVAYGVAVYSLVEYVTHRWVMHAVIEAPALRRLTGGMAAEHAGHHADPGQFRGALNVNQVPVMGAALVLLGLGLAMPWPAAFALFAVASGAMTHLAQEMVHFACHQLPMRGPVLSRIKRRHMLHHHRAQDCHYGILFGVWDRLLGTELRAR